MGAGHVLGDLGREEGGEREREGEREKATKQRKRKRKGRKEERKKGRMRVSRDPPVLQYFHTVGELDDTCAANMLAAKPAVPNRLCQTHPKSFPHLSPLLKLNKQNCCLPQVVSFPLPPPC